MTTLETRFWGKVEKVEKADGCWLWTGGKDKDGYGMIAEGAPSKRYLRTHRVSYELNVGPIPTGLCVLHSCDTPACVNPDHLFLGTVAVNNADMAAKGRRRGTLYLPGEMNHKAKLTDALVIEIRRRYSTERIPQMRLARQYEVHHSVIADIISGNAWKHLPCIDTDKPIQTKGTHYRGKLTQEEVDDIRRIYSEGGITQTALGKQFGVHGSEIGRIVNGKRWNG